MTLTRRQRNVERIRRTLAGGLLVGGSLLLAGCDDSASNRATVFGTVELDGQPLESGSIGFFPVEGATGPTAGATIKAGEYRIESAKGATIGKNRVEIHGMRKTKTIPDLYGRKTQIQQYEEIVPEKYHSASTLTREVAPGENRLDFEILSQP